MSSDLTLSSWVFLGKDRLPMFLSRQQVYLPGHSGRSLVVCVFWVALKSSWIPFYLPYIDGVDVTRFFIKSTWLLFLQNILVLQILIGLLYCPKFLFFADRPLHFFLSDVLFNVIVWDTWQEQHLWSLSFDALCTLTAIPLTNLNNAWDTWIRNLRWFWTILVLV